MLASWAASPARFREDANAEEDLVLGGYRDRVVVELAQNAADSAARVGGRARLRLFLVGAELRVANTGAPLDTAGVESLSTLRASAKRDVTTPSVGHFGVGFAAVLAVSDEPSIVSTTGGVRWSRSDTVAAVREIASLHDELARRGDAVPVLRLPFTDAGGPPPAGYDTEVRLPLRDSAAESLVRDLLVGVDAALLLMLPGLESVEVVVDGSSRTITAQLADDEMLIDGVRWRASRASGTLDPELMRGRGVEARTRTFFEVTWAIPVDDADRPAPLPAGVPQVAHAPTPTDEPVTLPAMLVASFPLDPTRRHIAPGPLSDFLVDVAARLYVELVVELPSAVEVARLVPAGVASGTLDGQLRAAIMTRLREAAFLPTQDSEVRLRPSHSAVLEIGGVPAGADVVDALADALPALLPVDWVRHAPQAIAALGVPRVALSEVLEELASLHRPANWWHALYAALADGGVSTDLLAGLPVPLAAGGLARSPRGVLMPGAVADLSVFGLRSVDPEAAHPLLLRLGAVEPEPTAILTSDAVRTAVENSYDAEDPLAIAEPVLRLVSAAAGNELPWLAELALPTTDGDFLPAGELLLPRAKLSAVVADDAPFGMVDHAFVERWGADLLTSVGVLDTFAVVREHDVSDADHDLDLEADYFAYLAAEFEESEPVTVDEFVAVRDLEFVRDDAWPQALALLTAAELRAAVVTPALAATSTQRKRVLSYTAWWLRTHGVVRGRLASSDSLLHGLYDVVELDFDDEFLAAAGAFRAVTDVDDDALVERLADPSRDLGRAQVRALYGLARPRQRPAKVRALRGGALVVVDAADAVVVDQPDLLFLLGKSAVLPASLENALDVADALDLALATELAEFPVLSEGVARDDHVVHQRLLVADVDGNPTNVRWRLADGVLHVDASAVAFGLGRGRAWRTGDWRSRHLLTELLTHPDEIAILAAEADLD